MQVLLYMQKFACHTVGKSWGAFIFARAKRLNVLVMSLLSCKIPQNAEDDSACSKL